MSHTLRYQPLAGRNCPDERLICRILRSRKIRQRISMAANQMEPCVADSS